MKFPLDEDADANEEEEEEEGDGKKEPDDLVEVVASTETDAALQSQITDLMDKISSGGTSGLSGDGAAEADPDPDFDDELEFEPPSKILKPDEKNTPQTLRGILENSGLAKFSPNKKETDKDVLKRMRGLLPAMQSFASKVRVDEKIISYAAVYGCKKPLRKHNWMEHQLARARATFHCSSERQSRHAMWMAYSQRIQSVCTPDAEKGDEDQTSGAQKITGFRRFHAWFCV